MTTDRPATVGVLLAGGLARRMGGGDKPLKTIAGRTILDHVIARLKPQCDELILNANGDPARFAAFGLKVVADTVEGFAGPLAGVLAALDWTASASTEHRVGAECGHRLPVPAARSRGAAAPGARRAKRPSSPSLHRMDKPIR